MSLQEERELREAKLKMRSINEQSKSGQSKTPKPSSGSSKEKAHSIPVLEMLTVSDYFNGTTQTSQAKKGNHISKTFKGRLMTDSTTSNQGMDHQSKEKSSGNDLAGTK